MKGRDLIECIQKYGLEDYDFPVCGEDGFFHGYISLTDASRKYHVSMSDIRTLVRNGDIRMVKVLNKELVSENEAKDILTKYAEEHRANYRSWKERKNEFTSSRDN